MLLNSSRRYWFWPNTTVLQRVLVADVEPEPAGRDLTGVLPRLRRASDSHVAQAAFTVEVSVLPLVRASPALALTVQIFGSAGVCAQAAPPVISTAATRVKVTTKETRMAGDRTPAVIFVVPYGFRSS